MESKIIAVGLAAILLALAGALVAAFSHLLHRIRLANWPPLLRRIMASASGVTMVLAVLVSGCGNNEDTSNPPSQAPVSNEKEVSKLEVFQDPIWNLWTERLASAELASVLPAFAPTTLEPNHDYSLVVNLAGLKFSDEQGRTAFSKGVSSTFAEWLDRHLNVSAVDLTVIALVDTEYFELRDGHVKWLRVDLAKIRQARQDGFYVPGSPFEYLRSHNGEAPFSFGWQSFRIRTTTRIGSASIAISIWVDGKPVDELTVTLCILASSGGTTCEGKVTASNRLAGVDLTMRGIYPDLALHLIDRKRGVVGVLRCNSCGWPENDYREWELGDTADWVSKQMNDITATIGGLSESLAPDDVQHAITNLGEDIYNVIFHSRTQDNDASRAFAQFMAKAQAIEKDGKPPPSLFVRIIPERPNLMVAPIGLMHLNPTGAAPEFVGFAANVQTPLEYQDYSPSSDCISKWVLFVPPETLPPKVPRTQLEAVLDARQPFKDWITAFKQSCTDCVIDTEDDFQNWLAQSGPRESRAVVILSHHSSNALYFNEMPGSPRVLSSAVRRPFASPSFVILDACGTSEPGASEFIRQFNFRGVMSAIATSTKVEPVLAGKFLATFMALLRDHENDGDYTVSQARFDAVKMLRREYGPKPLAFILAGNGALRLCVP